MEFVERVKNAIVPDTTEPVTSGTPQPETDIPGAFPDSDDEQEVERQNQKNLAQGVSASRPRAAGTEAEEASESRQTFGERGPILSHESLGLSPDKHEIPRGSITHHRESHVASPDNTGSPMPGGEVEAASAPKIPTSGGQQLDANRSAEAGGSVAPSSTNEAEFAMADKDTTTTQVQSQHLGNEGTTPLPHSPTTGDVKREEAQSGTGDPAAAAADGASESLGQYSGSGSAGLKISGNGGIRNGVLGRGDSHLGTHLGLAPTGASSQEENRAPAGEEQAQGILPGGVHNTVLGHRSEHPHGEGENVSQEGQQERRRSSGSGGSRAKRGDVAVLSGVSGSGLGLGGVHNGVVGHGSNEEEGGRHQTSSEKAQPASTTI